jgi:hypothetical protein
VTPTAIAKRNPTRKMTNIDLGSCLLLLIANRCSNNTSSYKKRHPRRDTPGRPEKPLGVQSFKSCSGKYIQPIKATKEKRNQYIVLDKCQC